MWEVAYNAAESGMKKISNWLSHNLLTLNMEKTKVVNFGVTNRTTAVEIQQAPVTALSLNR